VLGCKTDDSKELAEFLSTVPAQQLVEVVSKAMTEEVNEESKAILLLELKILNFRPSSVYRTQVGLVPKKLILHH
jgi:hypothetical protein